MASLYEQDAAAWDRLAKSGRPALRDMADQFQEFCEMEQALGFGHSVVKKWLDGRSNPSSTAERRAAAWLRDRASVAPASPPCAAPSQSAATFLCVAPAGKYAQVQKVLRMLGCEIVDIED